MLEAQVQQQVMLKQASVDSAPIQGPVCHFLPPRLGQLQGVLGNLAL